MEKVLSNADVIIKWSGYIMLIVAILCIIGTLCCAFSLQAEKHLVEWFMYGILSFFISIAQFATYIVVRAAKVYLQKNNELSL